MSHAEGRVLFKKDNFIMYYEYDGTRDILLNCLYDERKDIFANWRNQPDNKCICGREEDVVIADSYDGGAYHEGKACRYCKAFITSDCTWDDWMDIEKDGLPNWWVSNE